MNTDNNSTPVGSSETGTQVPERPRPGKEDDDNALESIGKAISAPIEGAAEDEEPGPDGQPRERPGD